MTEAGARRKTRAPKFPHVGLPANELLKMAGRSSDEILVWPSKVTGEDDHGLLVDWEYADCTVHLHHRQGQYRVAGVAMKDIEGGSG